MSSPPRVRPDRPYRRIPVRRLLLECNRRLRDARGPRAFELLAALVYRWPNVQSGIVYLGDLRMGELMGGRCARTAHRAKYDLLRAGLVQLHHAGPRLCPCRRCNGGTVDASKSAGGTILDGRGRLVACATGYALDPDLFRDPIASRPPGGPVPARGGYVSPYEERVKREGREKLARAMDSIASKVRAGPP